MGWRNRDLGVFTEHFRADLYIYSHVLLFSIMCIDFLSAMLGLTEMAFFGIEIKMMECAEGNFGFQTTFDICPQRFQSLIPCLPL